jgi:hypothetical protein
LLRTTNIGAGRRKIRIQPNMTTQYTSGRITTGTLVAFLLAVFLGAVGLAVFLRHAETGLPGRLATLIAGRSTSFNTSVPAVVEKIQALNRLETVVYSLDSVVEGDKSSPVFPDILAGDKILLVVHGQSIAGIDLSKLKPEDVHIEGTDQRSIHINLPPSEIFVTTLDNAKTRVYARTTGLLVPADQNLESDTRTKAQQQLQEAALSDGILDAARKNARATISALLFSIGFQHVEVI